MTCFKSKFRLAGMCAAFFIQSCALPRPEFEDQQFVPKKDVISASLVNDGLALYRAGRMQDAELKFRAANYLYPEAENIRANLALTLKSLGLRDEAFSIYEELIKSNPKRIDYRFALADGYYQFKDYPRALKLFRQVFEDYVANSEFAKAVAAARTISSIYFLTGDHQGALCYSSVALDLGPGRPEMIRHVRVLTAVGLFKEADALLQGLIAAEPPALEDVMVLKQLAISKYALKDSENAFKYTDLAQSGSISLEEQDAELLFLSYLMRTELEKQKAAQKEKEGGEDGDEKSDEELEKERAELVKVRNMNPLISLYWPYNLLEAYHAIPEEEDE